MGVRISVKGVFSNACMSAMWSVSESEVSTVVSRAWYRHWHSRLPVVHTPYGHGDSTVR